MNLINQKVRRSVKGGTSRREQSAVFAPRRATIPVRGSVSTRVKFHNLPIELPPPPAEPPSDHMY